MKKILLIILIFYPIISFVSAENIEWLDADKLIEFYPDTNGVNIVLASVKSNYSLCNDGARFSLSLSHKNYQVIASALLTAFTTKQKVKVVIKKDTSCAPLIDRVVLINYQ